MILNLPIFNTDGSVLTELSIIYDEKIEKLLLSRSWQPKYENNSWRIISRQGKKGNIQLGRFIWENLVDKIPDKMVVDHKNNNPLDNRIENLRLCSRTENTRNSAPSKTVKKTSIYKGVCKNKKRSKWIASIRCEKSIYIGSFSSEVEAARAYNKKAMELFGDFAWLNPL